LGGVKKFQPTQDTCSFTINHYICAAPKLNIYVDVSSKSNIILYFINEVSNYFTYKKCKNMIWNCNEKLQFSFVILLVFFSLRHFSHIFSGTFWSLIHFSHLYPGAHLGGLFGCYDRPLWTAGTQH